MGHINSALLLFAITFTGCVFARSTNSTQVKSKGICTLEVPTLDLIHEDERHLPIPAGNGSRPGYSKIQVCCSGYKLKDHTAHTCIPDCGDGCEHGNCTAPSVCECHKGYVKDPKGVCVPTCPIGCANGVCNVMKQCSCNAGYTLDTTGQMCLPVCKGGCGIAGTCVGPDNCECNPGFEKSARGICEYHCDKGCYGGDCVGPNKCVCKPGFKETNGVCEPQCPNGCRYGECTGPNQCSCKPGWTLDKTKTTCEAHCDEPCLNGICSAPNECTCKSGYIKDSFKKNRCVAHCPTGCPNGVCSAPNFCICNQGYVKQGKGSNMCVKRERRFALHHELIPEQLDD